MPSSYNPPSSGASGLPTVIGINPRGEGITIAVSGHGNQQVFGNTDAYFFNANGEAILASSTSSSIATFFSTQGGGTAWDIQADGTVFFGGNTFTFAATTSAVYMPRLPTSDPGDAGQLWSNLGIVTVSAG